MAFQEAEAGRYEFKASLGCRVRPSLKNKVKFNDNKEYLVDIDYAEDICKCMYAYII